MLELRLSGGAANNSGNSSLGGIKSHMNIADAVGENLIDDVTRKEVIIGKTEYRCFYIHNSGRLPVHGGIIFIDEDPSATSITIGLDPVGSGDGVISGLAQNLIDENTSPTGVTFEDAGEFRVKLALPFLKPGDSQAIWMKRIATAGQGGTITIGITATGNEESATDGVSIGERTSFVDHTSLESVSAFLINTARIGFAVIG